MHGGCICGYFARKSQYLVSLRACFRQTKGPKLHFPSVYSLVRNLDLSIHVYGFLEPSQNETGQQLLFSWALRREHPSFQVWSTCTSSRCVHASGKVRVQNCTSQVFSLARNLDLLIHVYGFLQSSQTKPANNYRSHGVYNKNIILSKGLGHFAAVVSLHQPKCQLAST